MKCFYHRADLDGICAGAIVRKKYPTCVMIGFDYGDTFRFEALNPKEMHIFVDMSLPPSDMKRLVDEDIKIAWIDHHYSAIKDSEAFGYAGMRGIRVLGVGACALTWRYFFESKIPPAVEMLAAYDVWNHKNPDTIPFHCGVNSLGLTVHSFIWERFFSNTNLNYYIKTGKKILEHIKLTTKTIVELTAHIGIWQGQRVAFINSCISDALFYYFIDQEKLLDCDIIVSYYKSKDGRYKVSLRSQKNSINVSTIAKDYGGGGHAMAAGFICEVLPWERADGK